MAYIYNLTDTWNAAGTTFAGIKMVVTNTASASGSALLDLSVSGATTGYFIVDKNANLSTSGKINKYTFTAPAIGATLALADGSTFTTVGGYATTLTTTGATNLTLPTSGTLTTTSNNLSVFASTTSAQLAGVISDETGSGSLVFSTSPTLTTPNLGTPSALTLTNATGLPVGGISATGTPSVSTYLRGDGSWAAVSSGSGDVTGPASSTDNAVARFDGTTGKIIQNSAVTIADTTGDITGGKYNGLTISTSTGTVTIANGKTFALDNSVTLVGTDSSTVNFGTGGTIAYTGGTLAQFASTTSSQLAGVISDETGSGPLVFATSPTFTSAITLGTASTTQGSMVLANTSANSVTLKSSNSTSAAYTLTLPTTAGTNGYFLQTDGVGNLAWAAGGGGGGGSVAGSDTQVQFNDGGSFGASAGFTFAKASYTLTLGVQQTSQGAIVLANTAAGAYSTTLKASNSASAAWTLTLPTTAGTNGYVLSTDGTGVTSWAAATTGTVTSVSGTGTVNGLTLTGTVTSSGSLTLGGTLSVSSSDISGQISVAKGGTGLASGTSGGVLYYSATGTLASSAALAANALVVGGGAGAAPSTITTGTGVVTALGNTAGAAGGFATYNQLGALATITPGTGVATFLTTPSSANLAAAVTDETGSGALVFATSPSLTTPTLGVASATSVNKVAITAPATSATLTIADGKTLTASNTLTLAGTDSTTMTFPASSATVAGLGITQSFTGTQTFAGTSSVLAAIFNNAAEVATVSATAATGTINYDVSTQSVLYYTTNASANWTLNVRHSSGTSLNTAMSTGQSITIAFLVTQGATAYYNNTFQIDGSSVTPKWQGGTAPTAGNASSIDVYTYTIVKTGSAAFTAFASLTQFK